MKTARHIYQEKSGLRKCAWETFNQNVTSKLHLIIKEFFKVLARTVVIKNKLSPQNVSNIF